MAMRVPADWEPPPEGAFSAIAERLRSQPNFGGEEITEKGLVRTTGSLVAFCHAQFGPEGRAKVSGADPDVRLLLLWRCGPRASP